MKRTLFLFALLLGLMSVPDVRAQWDVGAFYIAREDGAQNGGGLVLERAFDGKEGEMQLGLRAQASYATASTNLLSLRYRSGLFDLSVTGSMPYRALRPYFGLGLGVETYAAQAGRTSGYPSFASADGYGLMQVGTALLPERRLSPYIGAQVRRLFSGYEAGYELPAGVMQGELVLGLSVSL